MESMFEPFQSNFEGGTGLGLALVYQILQAHQAKILVRSELGAGAEFVLSFLRAEEPAAEAVAAIIEAAKAERDRGKDVWATYSFATMNAPSARCWRSPCGTMAITSRP